MDRARIHRYKTNKFSHKTARILLNFLYDTNFFNTGSCCETVDALASF